jgi:type VI secretion system protein ImpB
VSQVPRLAKLLEARQQLRDLLAKLDGNDELDDLLERVLLNTEDLKTVQSQARAEAGSAPAQAAPAAAAVPQAAAETQSSPEAEAPAA